MSVVINGSTGITSPAFTGDGSGLTNLPVSSVVEVVSAGDAIGVSSLSFTGLDTDNYTYEFVLENLIPTSDNVFPVAQFSIDNGSSYVSANYNCYSEHHSATASTNVNNYQPNLAYFYLVEDTCGSAAGEYGYTAMIKITQDNGTYPQIHTIGSHVDNGGVWYAHQAGGYTYNTTSKVNAIRFYFTAGNIESGRYVLYRKARA